MLRIYEDRRIGGVVRLYLSEEQEAQMLVPAEIKECVVFLCYRAGEAVRFAGTGFFITVSVASGEGSFFYLVTARHVIEGIAKRSTDQKVLLRANTVSGGTALVECPVSVWRFHPTEANADVAALPWAPDQAQIRYKTIPLEMFATDDVIKEHNIGFGDEVFFPGLFVVHYGEQQNRPLMRIGNIAAMPEEPVNTRWCGPMEAYLVEARSIGGLSGSPVFAHLILGRGGNLKLGSPRFFLLGLMHGHYDSPLTEADDATIDDAESERVNMGIAVVVPATKILETINQEWFLQARKEHEEKLRQAAAAVPDESAQA